MTVLLVFTAAATLTNLTAAWLVLTAVSNPGNLAAAIPLATLAFTWLEIVGPWRWRSQPTPHGRVETWAGKRLETIWGNP